MQEGTCQFTGSPTRVYALRSHWLRCLHRAQSRCVNSDVYATCAPGSIFFGCEPGEERVACVEGAPVWRHLAQPKLRMRNFSDAFLDAYLAGMGEATLLTVGAYEIEGRGAQLFDRIEGDHFSIIGLPLLPLLGWLRDRGTLPA